MSNKTILSALFFVVSILGFPQQETLFIFTDTLSEHKVIQDFNSNTLPQLKTLAKAQSLRLRILNNDSIVEGLTKIPAIAFRKNFYKGRYNSISKIETFILTQKVFSLPKQDLNKEQVYVHQDGKMNIGLILKYFKLSGAAPEGFNQDDFNKKLFNTLGGAFKSFTKKSSFNFGDHDKLYYLNIYPWRSETGSYYMGIELFSQFSCVDPVLSITNEPFVGDNLTEALSKIASQIDTHLPTIQLDTNYGDGYLALKSKSYLTWEDLGLKKENDQSKMTKANYTNGTWKVSTSSLGAPIYFTFPPPVSSYSGYINTLQGSMSIEEQTLSGRFEAPLEALTMGDEGLDHSVHEQMQILVFPKASIAINHTTLPTTPGESFPTEGTLNFMGIERELIFNTVILVDQDDNLIIQAETSFSIANDQTLEKPEGPAPENETINVSTRIFLSKP